MEGVNLWKVYEILTDQGGAGDRIGSERTEQLMKGNRFCGGVLCARPYATYREHTDGTTPEKVG